MPIQTGVTLTSFSGYGYVIGFSGGVYSVNQRMLQDLFRRVFGTHASNLGAIMAHDVAVRYGVHAYVANPVVVDELSDVARISGHPDIPHRSIFHALSQKAVAEKAALKIGKKYNKCNLVVAHIGGGVTIGTHKKGMVVDVNDGLEGVGPFSPERTGGLSVLGFYRYATEHSLTFAQAEDLVERHGGLLAHLGTNDCRVIVERIKAGDKKAELLFNAFIYGVGKAIGAAAAALSGKVDAIVLTGEALKAKMVLRKLRAMVKFIAPVHAFVLNSEMEALALAAFEVYTGTKKALLY